MKTTVFSLALLFLLTFSGCTEDGVDGQAYLAIDWDWTVDTYWDNNPGIPSSITRNKDYAVEPGQYDYEYSCSDGQGNEWGYEGTYTIEINYGTEAELFSDGTDGADKYYTFNLSGLGSTMTAYDMEKSSDIRNGHSSDSNNMIKVRIPNNLKKSIGSVTIEKHLVRSSIITVTSQRFVLE